MAKDEPQEPAPKTKKRSLFIF